MCEYNTIIPEGWHWLSGFSNYIVQSGCFDEDVNGLVVQVDGKNYCCYEDPSDGYRSYTVLQETDLTCTNTFPRQKVMVKHVDTGHDRQMMVYNPDFELILLLGTDYYDDYYPTARFEWHPECLPINKGVVKAEYVMPAELTMKLNALLPDIDHGIEVLDLIDQYYKDAYRKGVLDVILNIERTIGSVHDFQMSCDLDQLGQYVSSFGQIIEVLQKIDPRNNEENDN